MKSVFTNSVFVAILGLSFFFHSPVSAENSDHLNCFEFQSVLHFVQTQHLRFDTMTSFEKAGLLSVALKETPDALRSLGYSMLAARFESLNFSQQKTKKSAFELCESMESTIFRGAFLKAFIKHLDPYSDFYLSEELESKSSALEGEFVGVGIGTEPEGEYLKVNEVVPGGPADQKLFVGDHITQIDGHTVAGLTETEVRQRIRGEKGSSVHFEVRRASENIRLSIVRDTVHQKSVASSWLDNHVLLIRIHRFFRQTAQEVEHIVRTEGPQAKGFILDLRNNPGGLLQGARDIVDLFVSQGVVVYLKGRGAEDQVWALREGGELKKPLVVLVNGGTASAAEIVAGALQDYGRAVLVGQKTYGKGSVQNIYETQNIIGTQYRGGLKLTTLWYYLPSGRSVRALEPDVKISSKSEAPVHAAMPYMGPERIDVARNFMGTGKFNFTHGVSSSQYVHFEDSEEAGKALLLKMLAGSPLKTQTQ